MLNLMLFAFAILGGVLNFAIGYSGSWMIKNHGSSFPGLVSFILMFVCFPGLAFAFVFYENSKLGIHGIRTIPENPLNYIMLAIILVPWLVGASLPKYGSSSKKTIGEEAGLRRR